MKERIGFIGLGNMGKPMAENLARAGFPVTVFDLKSEPIQDLVALGAQAATSPREVAAASDIICSVVMNNRQTLEVMLGEDGVLAGATPGSLILLHSTISIETCEKVANVAAQQSVGVLDAAVSGAAERSRAGTLSVMVGGDEEMVARAQPIFDVIGEKTYHLGGLGMGQAAKMCNNLMCLVNVQVVEEALRLARETGIDETRMRELAQASSGDSWALRHIDAMRELAAIHTDGEVDMSIFGRKDIALASKLALNISASTPITDFVFDQMKK